MKDPTIDSELVYAYAKTNAGTAMEEFVSGTNTANVQQIGDRLYEEKNYVAAKARPSAKFSFPFWESRRRTRRHKIIDWGWGKNSERLIVFGGDEPRR